MKMGGQKSVNIIKAIFLYRSVDVTLVISPIMLNDQQIGCILEDIIHATEKLAVVGVPCSKIVQITKRSSM